MLTKLRNINIRYRITTLAAINAWLLISFLVIFSLARTNLQSNNNDANAVTSINTQTTTSAKQSTGLGQSIKKFLGLSNNGTASISRAFLVPMIIVLIIWAIIMVLNRRRLSHLFDKQAQGVVNTKQPPTTDQNRTQPLLPKPEEPKVEYNDPSKNY